MSVPSIVVTGSVGIDTIETPDDRAEDVVGGSASHFAVAASMYTDVALVGIVGKDFPESHRKLLEDRKVDLRGLEVAEDGETFRWTGKYHENLNHRDTLSVALNVYEDYTPRVPDELKKARIVFLANIGPDVQMSLLDQIPERDLVAADTMELWIETRRDEVLELLKRIDILFINEDEARHFTQEHNLIHAGRKLLGWGPETVVLKKGSHGALMFRGEEIFCAPAYPWTRVVDPTGAGDSFAGGFLGYLAQHGWEDPEAWRKAVIHGSIQGSINVEGFSCRAFEDLADGVVEHRFGKFEEITRF